MKCVSLRDSTTVFRKLSSHPILCDVSLVPHLPEMPASLAMRKRVFSFTLSRGHTHATLWFSRTVCGVRVVMISFLSSPAACLLLCQKQLNVLKNAVVANRIRLVRQFVALVSHQRVAVAKQTALQRDKDTQAVMILQLQGQVSCGGCSMSWDVE